MKHVRLSLLALPLLLAAGCQAPELPSKNPSAEPEAANAADWPVAPSIAAYTHADKWTDNGVDRCQFVLTYPELVRPRTWTPEDPARDPALDRANREIMRTYGLISATGTIALKPEEVGGEFIELCKSDLEDMSRELGPESIDNMSYVDDSTFTTHLLTPDLASLSIETYQYTGGAHGNPGIQAINIDLATGQKLTLGDVIKHDQLQSVMKTAYAEVLKTYEDGLFEAARTEINTLVNDTTVMPTEEQMEKFGSATNFFLTGEGVMFFWNVYEITPYAAGQPMTLVKWSDLKNKLSIKRP